MNSYPITTTVTATVRARVLRHLKSIDATRYSFSFFLIYRTRADVLLVSYRAVRSPGYVSRCARRSEYFN